ncbi:hypothetical protein [Mongoliibacter ruber]|uniref:Uncharacterized protein n=1 Tax=Mongoliibacter ruber TaxID=1750599 RepID=A0A2T0WVF6_9BACT|nr:hypothetical protein [Mongoliibacter ruber]PRY90564.1 hypothetical protein CLW00_101227 [Mongoliibacter ruber]
MNLEIHKILTRWTERTSFLMKMEQKRLEIGDTNALNQSQAERVLQKSETLLESELEFLVRGRMVDMGAGRGSRKIETRDGNGRLVRGKNKPRKPKKWYSRIYWGRINALQGVLGFKLMESSIRSVKDVLEERPGMGTIGRPRL